MEFLSEIWTTIQQNRSRSILTGFGVFWGMFMLLVLLGIGEGFNGSFREVLGSVPPNSVMMGSSQTAKPYKGLPQGRFWQIQTSDLDILKKDAKSLDKLCPVVWGDRSEKNVRYEDFSGSYTVIGVMPEYGQLYSVRLAQGRFINEMDIESSRKVCILGQTVYKQLFPAGGNCIGEVIHVGNIQYRVAGVLAASKQGLGDNDENVIMPITTLQRAYNRGQDIHQLVVSARSGFKAADVEVEVKTILRRIHMIAPDDEKAIWAWNFEGMVQGISYTIIGLSMLLWLIGIGTLVSGAVGVSNIMLVTIRERTREIGIRRALGASPWVIVRQIMAESLLLTTISGLLGIVLAVGVLHVVNPLFTNMLTGNMKMSSVEINFSLAMGALIINIIIGLLAGLMPAIRALRIKPIEALSDE